MPERFDWSNRKMYNTTNLVFCKTFQRKWAGLLVHHCKSCFLEVCWWEMSPTPFLLTVYLRQIRGREREGGRGRGGGEILPIPLHQLLPWWPTANANSCIAPGASQQGLHHWLCHHRIVHSLALPFCPFHWAGAPSSNSRREEEVGNGEWSMRGSSKPPRSQNPMKSH